MDGCALKTGSCHGNNIALNSECKSSISCHSAFILTYIRSTEVVVSGLGGSPACVGMAPSSLLTNVTSLPPSNAHRWNPVIGKYSLRHDTGESFPSGENLLTLLSPFLFLCTVLRDTLNRKFSVAFSIIGMFSSHAVSTLSIFFCAEITPTVIR